MIKTMIEFMVTARSPRVLLSAPTIQMRSDHEQNGHFKGMFAQQRYPSPAKNSAHAHIHDTKPDQTWLAPVWILCLRQAANNPLTTIYNKQAVSRKQNTNKSTCIHIRSIGMFVKW